LQAFTWHGKAIALAIGEDPPGVLVACSADSGINAGAVLKQTLAKFGSKGGGSATSAQGALPGSEAAAELASALGVQLPVA
jgi:alanyl-tRNA synthetase